METINYIKSLYEKNDIISLEDLDLFKVQEAYYEVMKKIEGKFSLEKDEEEDRNNCLSLVELLFTLKTIFNKKAEEYVAANKDKYVKIELNA